MKNNYVIAIGASAGGLEPILKFFDSTPNDDVSYVILRHLSPSYESMLKEIMKKHSRLEILEVKNSMKVEKNKVYLLPASYYMIIQNGKLKLVLREDATFYPNWAINIFLKSLALEKGNKSIAVILSGSGTDGSDGISLIKQAGGMVMVQEPDSCEHNSMPNSAIKTGDVDYILHAHEMPGVISSYVGEKMIK